MSPLLSPTGGRPSTGLRGKRRGGVPAPAVVELLADDGDEEDLLHQVRLSGISCRDNAGKRFIVKSSHWCCIQPGVESGLKGGQLQLGEGNLRMHHNAPAPCQCLLPESWSAQLMMHPGSVKRFALKSLCESILAGACKPQHLRRQSVGCLTLDESAIVSLLGEGQDHQLLELQIPFPNFLRETNLGIASSKVSAIAAFTFSICQFMLNQTHNRHLG